MISRFAYLLDCPLCGRTIVLPPQSQIGTFVGQQCQPMGTWPIKFLCIVHAQLCECSADKIRWEAYPTPDPSQRQVALWMIVLRCAREGCGSSYTIFATEYADAEGEQSLKIALSKAVSGVCKGHETELDQASIQTWILPA